MSARYLVHLFGEGCCWVTVIGVVIISQVIFGLEVGPFFTFCHSALRTFNYSQYSI